MPGTIAAYAEDDGEAAFDALGTKLVMEPCPDFVAGVVPVVVAAALVGALRIEVGPFKQLVLANLDERTKSIKGNHHILLGSTVNGPDCATSPELSSIIRERLRPGCRLLRKILRSSRHSYSPHEPGGKLTAGQLNGELVTLAKVTKA